MAMGPVEVRAVEVGPVTVGIVSVGPVTVRIVTVGAVAVAFCGDGFVEVSGLNAGARLDTVHHHADVVVDKSILLSGGRREGKE